MAAFMIRDIIMYITAFSGIGAMAYLRIRYTQRTANHPEQPIDYTPEELRIRRLAFILIGIGIALACIPAKYIYR